jgi:carbohydrate kinase (thermoresistant glucokinase family)
MPFAPAVVMMGVSGSGKTTVGEALAERLGVRFRDADEFHPKANVEKMSAGVPLTDADRWPWLDAIGAAIRDAPREAAIVISCSALKRVYRVRILEAAERPVTFVHLTGSRALLAERMQRRRGHFMPPSLLDSQLATLEPLQADEPGFPVPIDRSVDVIVDDIAERLRQTR